jgi:hypothetical protein
MATLNDIPTHVWTLPTILAGSGIRYLSLGLNGGLVRANSFDKLFERSPFYWQGPDGSRVLTWVAQGYMYAKKIGLTENTTQVRKKLGEFLSGYTRSSYPYDVVLALGALGEDDSFQPALAATAEEWNRHYAYPKIIFARGPEFFEYLETGFRDKIPVLSGEGGAYWADGAASSALETGLVRNAKERLVAAEMIYALAEMRKAGAYPQTDFAAAWKDALLYDEHTWGSEVSVELPESPQTLGQWEYKSAFAHRAAAAADRLVAGGLKELAQAAGVEGDTVLVFNSQSYPVSGIVRVDLPNGSAGEFWADAVPPVGFKVFPLSGALAARASSIQDETRIENRFYRVELDPKDGTVRSIYDKDLCRELADATAPYRINQYLYFVRDGQAFKNMANENGPPSSITMERRNFGSA